MARCSIHIWTAIGAMLLLAVAAACGGATAPTATTTRPAAPAAPTTARATSPAPTAAPTATPGPRATPVAQPTPTTAPAGPRGSIVLVQPVEVILLDPHLFLMGTDYFYGWAVFDSLYGRDQKAEMVPNLATSYTVSADGKTWIYKLRPGVKFHNGDILTSADVRFSLERFLGDWGKKGAGGTAAYLRNIRSLETPDANTVVFQLAEPDATFHVRLADSSGIALPQKYIERVGNDAFATDRPMGAGPFKFVKRVGGQYTDLEAHEGYWGGAPEIKKVRLTLAAEAETRIAMLVTGEADIVSFIPPHMAKRVEAKPNLRVKRHATGLVQPVFFSSWQEKDPKGNPNPMRNLNVRKALIMAVDRDAIIKDIMMGEAIPVASYWGPNQTGYDPTVERFPYDPKKAREMLIAETFDFTQVYPVMAYVASPGAPEAVEAVAGNWNAIGVKTRYYRMESGAAMNELKNKNAWAAHLMRATHTNPDPSLVACGQMAAWPGQVYDPKLMQICNEDLPRIFDAKEREAALKNLYRYFHDQAIAVWMYEEKAIWGFGPRVDWDPVPTSYARGLERVKWRPGYP